MIPHKYFKTNCDSKDCKIILKLITIKIFIKSNKKSNNKTDEIISFYLLDTKNIKKKKQK